MTLDPPRVLVLWDIDHTLITAPGMGRLVYDRAFAAAVGRPMGEMATTPGRTDLDIMAETLTLNGIEPTEDLLTELTAAVIAAFHDNAAEMKAQGSALPGAEQTLASLAAETNLHQSVLTGNLREVARLKLATFGLADYLDLDSGAYGGDHPDRPTLVHIARQRAAEQTGVHFDYPDIVLVGDTPRDVDAALTSGSRVIAVATGSFTADELRAAGAHHVVADLTACGTLLKDLVSAA